jgi:Fe-S oxidoreductase
MTLAKRRCKASRTFWTGAAGFEKEHYDLSLKIGERRLFPSIRNQADAILVASGVSCRQQIEHATVRLPKHLIELIGEARRVLRRWLGAILVR